MAFTYSRIARWRWLIPKLKEAYYKRQEFGSQLGFSKFSRSDRRLNSRPLAISGILGFFGLGGSGSDEDEESPEGKLIYNIKLGVLAQQNGEFDKAEQLLHIALKMSQDMGHFDGTTYIFNQLANVAFERGDFMKAERLFKDVMSRLLSKGSAEDDNKMVGISLKLARIYGEWNQDEKAVVGYKFAIDAQEKKIKNGDNDEDTVTMWAMGRDWYAQFLLSRGMYPEARKEFEASFKTCKELFGEGHSQSMVLLNSLGTVSSLMEEHNVAAKYFERAVDLARKCDSSREEDQYIKSLLGLKGMALSNCTEGLSLAKRIKDEEVVDEAKECLEEAAKL